MLDWHSCKICHPLEIKLLLLLLLMVLLVVVDFGVRDCLRLVVMALPRLPGLFY